MSHFLTFSFYLFRFSQTGGLLWYSAHAIAAARNERVLIEKAKTWWEGVRGEGFQRSQRKIHFLAPNWTRYICNTSKWRTRPTMEHLMSDRRKTLLYSSIHLKTSFRKKPRWKVDTKTPHISDRTTTAARKNKVQYTIHMEDWYDWKLPKRTSSVLLDFCGYQQSTRNIYWYPVISALLTR